MQHERLRLRATPTPRGCPPTPSTPPPRPSPVPATHHQQVGCVPETVRAPQAVRRTRPVASQPVVAHHAVVGEVPHAVRSDDHAAPVRRLHQHEPDPFLRHQPGNEGRKCRTIWSSVRRSGHCGKISPRLPEASTTTSLSCAACAEFCRARLACRADLYRRRDPWPLHDSRITCVVRWSGRRSSASCSARVQVILQSSASRHHSSAARRGRTSEATSCPSVWPRWRRWPPCSARLSDSTTRW